MHVINLSNQIKLTCNYHCCVFQLFLLPFNEWVHICGLELVDYPNHKANITSFFNKLMLHVHWDRDTNIMLISNMLDFLHPKLHQQKVQFTTPQHTSIVTRIAMVLNINHTKTYKRTN